MCLGSLGRGLRMKFRRRLSWRLRRFRMRLRSSLALRLEGVSGNRRVGCRWSGLGFWLMGDLS